ncbi:hypothetical protein GO001_14430 [Streptomyces sp. NRRL B-1677]|uniref:hypothetical protein n=1 Tax=Streptomyces sp. NRRL B-1677 TaxID=2682966 RepID=UPI0018928918|nr:hypothetical protein [Streptomyces sp. NRRL B-1677]MBF6046408.1 hypothetical protein [Streptomyces sp. NRRL B-1677]
MRPRAKAPYSRWTLLLESIEQRMQRSRTRAEVKAGRVWICPGCHVAFYAHVTACRTYGCGTPRPELPTAGRKLA